MDHSKLPNLNFGFRSEEVLLVTGAGSGIGRATALLAAQMGVRVSAWDISQDNLASLARQITEIQGTVHTWTADISEPKLVQEGFDSIHEHFGEATYLFNNAGPASSSDITFENALSMSLGGTRLMTETWSQEELPEQAAMVVTTSVAGNKIGTDSDWYSTSKAALMGYVRHLATYRSDRFRSNGVAPGMTDTPRLAQFADSDVGRRSLERNPLKRMASPADIAYAALFLLSPAASYINGAMLPVDGGWTITQ